MQAAEKNCGGTGSSTMTSIETSPDLRVPLRAISASTSTPLARRELLQPRGRDTLCGDRHVPRLEGTLTSVRRVQRSLIFIYVGLEQGPISSFVYRPSAPRASRGQIDVFIAKRGLDFSSADPGILPVGARSLMEFLQACSRARRPVHRAIAQVACTSGSEWDAHPIRSTPRFVARWIV